MFGWLRPKAASAATIADDVQAANEPASSVDPDRLLRRLEWTVLRRLDGVLQGDYRTLFRGFGLDLADLREYQLNDDVRYMDWNVTARLQVPHVREFQEDREVAAWFVLDLSRLGRLRFAAGAQARAGERARRGAGAPVHALRQPGRRGAALGARQRSGPGAQRAPARAAHPRPHGEAGRAQRGCPRQPASAAITDLAELLATARPVIKRRSVLFVVSDFISTPGWSRRLARPRAPPRHRRGATDRPDGARAAGHRPGRDAGRRDGRATARRHARQGIPPTLRAGRGEAGRGTARRAGRRRGRLPRTRDRRAARRGAAALHAAAQAPQPARGRRGAAAPRGPEGQGDGRSDQLHLPVAYHAVAAARGAAVDARLLAGAEATRRARRAPRTAGDGRRRGDQPAAARPAAAAVAARRSPR